MHIDGNSSAIIYYYNRTIFINSYFNFIASSSKMFINSVIHYFIKQVVQAVKIGGADIHAGAFAHPFQALENLNVV